MTSYLYIVQLVLLIPLTLNAGCVREGEDMLEGRNETKAEEVRQLIASELQIGAEALTIEAFFKRHDIAFSYDRFAQRYQAIIRDVASAPKVDQAIIIYIYVDDQKRFARSEVNDSFTR
jgi:hypothetical protein